MHCFGRGAGGSEAAFAELMTERHKNWACRAQPLSIRPVGSSTIPRHVIWHFGIANLITIMLIGATVFSERDFLLGTISVRPTVTLCFIPILEPIPKTGHTVRVWAGRLTEQMGGV